MTRTMKLQNMKRRKSKKYAKRSLANMPRARKNKHFKYPITETLDWLNDGEKLLRKWGGIKSPGAKRIANAFSNLLGMLKSINELGKS